MPSQELDSASARDAYELLELTMAEADEARRADLLTRLSDARGLLGDSKVRVLVVGGPKQGKSALIEALLVTRRDVAGEAPSEISRLMGGRLPLAAPATHPGGAAEP